MQRILLIDDEPILRREVSDWLMLEGYDVISAEDGEAGAALALQYCPDLIVCDVMMPRMDGYGVLYAIRSNPSTAVVPFIFLTARASHEDVRRGMSSQADDYITKPFTRVELLQAIDGRLKKRELQDQAHQRELRELQQALAQEHEQRMLKSKVVAMYSHEFRNPLIAISFASKMLRHHSDMLNEPVRIARLDFIDASASQLLQMLDDMLLVAQMDTGNLQYKPERINSANLVHSIFDEFRVVHGETRQMLFEEEVDGTGEMRGDPRLLRQIFANLIGNAIKYSPLGSTVRVRLVMGKHEFSFAVQDEGVGIPLVDQAQLFTPFHRGSNVSETPGTGLGLTIVKQAVDMHGGSIGIDSAPGMGTTVTVRLPM